MTQIDHQPVSPTPPIQAAPPPARGGRIAMLAIAGVALCVALGAGAFAAADANPGALRHGMSLAFVQRMATRALDSAGATADQEAKVHDIIAARFDEIAPKPGEHDAMRKQALELLAAPTIDRAAVERLRADAVAKFDAKSKAVVGGLLDIADQLTPAQRAKLADEIAQLPPPRGPMGWGHPGGHPGPMFGSPDNGPDKD